MDLSSFWLALGTGRLGVGFLTRIFPLSLLIAPGAAVGVPALLLALLAHGRGLALATSVVCGLAFSGTYPSLVAQAQVRHGGSMLLTSVMVAASGVGGLVLPAAFGFATLRRARRCLPVGRDAGPRDSAAVCRGAFPRAPVPGDVLTVRDWTLG